MSFTLDTREFENAMRDRVRLLGKEAAKELNKRAGNVAMKAARETPKAKKGQIIRDLRKPVSSGSREPTPIQYHIINAIRRDGGIKGNRRFSAKLISSIGKGPALSGVEMAAARKKLQGKAVSASAYIAAGFLKVAADFGRTVSKKVSGKGLAGKSTGTKSTESNLTATLENMARGASEVALGAIQRALDREAADMAAHTMEELCKKAGWRG